MIREPSQHNAIAVVRRFLRSRSCWRLSLPRRNSADEPYARSRDYDLQHSKISLRFDIDQKKVLGEVTTRSRFCVTAPAKSLSTPSASTSRA